MKKICFWLAALALVGCLGTRAQAAPTYSYFYVAGQASYSVPVDTDVEVRLYLQEVSADSTSMLAAEGGVWGAGFRVALNNLPSDPATITSISGNAGTPPGGFDGGSIGPAPTSTAAAIVEYTSSVAGVMAGSQENGVSELYLGTVTIHTGSSVGQTTEFTVNPYALDSGNTYTNASNYDLDNNLDGGDYSNLYASAAATMFAVTTTPEPATVALLTLGALRLLRRRRRL